MTTKCSLIIKNFELTVSLGWTEEERSHKQTVRLDIELRFPNPPMACQSDELNETYCYDDLTNKVRDYVADKSFRLVEYLSGEIYLLVKKQMHHSVLVKIELTKHPVIANLNGGVKFSYGDFE